MLAAPAPVVLGEVLFDSFPDGREILGGAPFNVAWHLRGFGLSPRLVTRIGADDAGAAVRRFMLDWGLDDGWVQVDPERGTGRVEVGIEDGEPSFSIPPGQAWDRIEPPSADIFDDDRRLLYHGTLALRENPGLLTDALRSRSAGVFLDVNLRDPWWEPEAVTGLMAAADWIKLNGEELRRLAPRGDAGELCRRLELTGVVVTEGARLVSWWTADGVVAEVRPPGVEDLADAVGAGDAFSAVCLTGLAAGWSPGTILERAAGFAADICRRHGATSTDRELYRRPWIEGGD